MRRVVISVVIRGGECPRVVEYAAQTRWPNLVFVFRWTGLSRMHWALLRWYFGCDSARSKFSTRGSRRRSRSRWPSMVNDGRHPTDGGVELDRTATMTRY